jgi:hypothetical protein
MKTTTVQDICSELLAEIQELHANQRLMIAALEKVGGKMALGDVRDVKSLHLQQVKKETEPIQKRINSLGD